VDLTEKRRLDAARQQVNDARQQVDAAHQQANEAAREQVKKVKKQARPWRSIIALILALLMAAVSRSARADAASAVFTGTPYRALGHTGTEIVADAAAVAFCLLASAATAGLAGKARDVLRPKVGTAHAAVVRYAVVLFGGIATFLITLELFGIGVTQLLVGGAFATVLVGIAAQQSMANLFAGMVLLLARPVDVGDQVLVRSGSLGGDFRGEVIEIGITYVRLDTADGPVHLPNSQLLASAIAPLNSNPRLNSDPPANDRPPDGTAD
jgi:small-conductance mechanosensitive channel